MIAALYVIDGGPYFGLPDVDPWPESRDARQYPGPHPVVAHPPCQRWGRYWYGGPSVRVRKVLGDDGGCFAAALASVRRWGGVLEHPEASHAWRAFGLIAPLRNGGWSVADDVGGWTCCVEQGHYGHRARKATWLYAHGVELPVLRWGRSAASMRLDDGFHSKRERETSAARRGRVADPARAGADAGAVPRSPADHRRIGALEAAMTPLAFRDALLSMARSVVPREVAA